jgi:hypothetical protein
LRKTEEAADNGIAQEQKEWRAFKKFVFEIVRRYPEVLRELAEALRSPEWVMDS